MVTESVGLCISDEPRLKCSRQVLLHSESHFLASLLQYPEENQDFKIREILKRDYYSFWDSILGEPFTSKGLNVLKALPVRFS